MVTNQMRARARHRDGLTQVTVLLLHPMETGLRTDERGAVVPADYISGIKVSVGETILLRAQLTIAVSEDPLLTFSFAGGRPGERIRIEWTDNHGDQRHSSTSIT